MTVTSTRRVESFFSLLERAVALSLHVLVDDGEMLAVLLVLSVSRLIVHITSTSHSYLLTSCGQVV